jgi:acetyl-CoA synthetase
MYDGYGQTETTVLVANYRSMPVRPGSMGRPVPGWDVAVVDDDGGRQSPGPSATSSSATSPTALSGCSPATTGDPEATAEAFRAPGTHR